MGISSWPPASSSSSGSIVEYASTDTTGYSVATTTQDTAASLSIVTTSANTNWLVEITAAVTNGVVTSGNYLDLFAKVDGTPAQTDGTYGVSAAGVINRLTVRGRVKVTLGTASSHTVLARLSTNGTITFGVITITARQIT